VSVRPAGTTELGTKTELKNMNSFAFLQQGVEAEIERQVRLLEAGDAVVQETLHFDPTAKRLTPLRSKEEAHDYRYFPEPDLVPVVPSEEMLSAAREAIPELPADRTARFEHELGLNAARARNFAFRTELGDYFEAAVGAGDSVEPNAVANWIEQLVERIGSDTDPAESRVSAENTEIVARAIDSDPSAADQVRAGNMRATGPIVGFVMRETKGGADGGEVTRLIRQALPPLS
jgi:aspartyl-tRNA(Asn)/glutamyl-tRNA(Gln) amidotransferase subunit B